MLQHTCGAVSYLLAAAHIHQGQKYLWGAVDFLQLVDDGLGPGSTAKNSYKIVLSSLKKAWCYRLNALGDQADRKTATLVTSLL